MLVRMKARRTNERLDRVQQDLLMAVKVSEEELDAVADSPDLYDGLRVRIAAGRAPLSDNRMATEGRRAGERGRPNVSPALWAQPSLRWTLTAATVLLLAALATLLLLPKQSVRTTEVAPVLPLLTPSPPGEVRPPENASKEGSETAQIVTRDPTPSSAVRSSHRHHRRDSSAAELATDFFPLTFTADSAASESGNVVRVKIARTALIAFGLPMNAARAGELITADVVIGDDGLARAIRFIQ